MTAGFVYIWHDKKRNMYYIGSHRGHQDDGYVCSSRRMRAAFKRRPADFRRRIISAFEDITKSELLAEEQKWLTMIEENELGKKYYNLKRVAGGGRIVYGEEHKAMCRSLWDDEKKQRQAERMKKEWTPERRAAHSQKMREKWKETSFRESMDLSERARSGWKDLDETARKERASRRKWEISDETRRRMSEAAARRASDPEYKKKFVERTAGTRTRNDGHSY